MTDIVEPDAPGPSIYLFGFRAPAELRLDPNPLALFLMGRKVPLDDALAAALLAEFGAQERYRTVLLDTVQRACGLLLEEACKHVAQIEQPFTDATSAFWRGYALGKYEACSMAAGALSEVQIVAAMGVKPEGTDNDSG